MKVFPKCVDGFEVSERSVHDVKEKFKTQIEKNLCHVELANLGNVDDPVILDKMGV